MPNNGNSSQRNFWRKKSKSCHNLWLVCCIRWSWKEKWLQSDAKAKSKVVKKVVKKDEVRNPVNYIVFLDTVLWVSNSAPWIKIGRKHWLMIVLFISISKYLNIIGVFHRSQTFIMLTSNKYAKIGHHHLNWPIFVR